jgi:hypothetical protein
VVYRNHQILGRGSAPAASSAPFASIAAAAAAALRGGAAFAAFAAAPAAPCRRLFLGRLFLLKKIKHSFLHKAAFPALGEEYPAI